MLRFALESANAKLTEDACVPIARLADFVRAGQAVAARTGVRITLAGHGGDGGLTRRSSSPGDADGERRALAWTSCCAAHEPRRHGDR